MVEGELTRVAFASVDPRVFDDFPRDPRSYHSTPEQLLGTNLAGAQGGIARGVLDPGPHLHLGWAAPLVDLCMGHTYNAARGDGSNCVTISMRVEATGAPLSTEHPVYGFGTVDDPASPSGLGVTILSQNGRAVAHATGRFAPFAPPLDEEFEPVPELTLQQLGVTLEEQFELRREEPGSFSFLSDRQTANPSGVMHGGLQVALAVEAALVEKRGEDGWRPVSISAEYLRPALSTVGGRMTLRVSTIQSGRSLYRNRAELVRPDGDVATTVETTLARSFSR